MNFCFSVGHRLYRDNIHPFRAASAFDIVFPRQHATILGSARIPFFHFFFIAKPLYPAMLDCALIDIFILLHVSLVQHLQRVLLVVNDNIHQFWAVFVFDIVFPREHATILGSARIPFFFFSLFFLSRGLCTKQCQTARSLIFLSFFMCSMCGSCSASSS